MNSGLIFFSSVVGSLLIVFFGIPVLRRLAYQWKLYDVPTEERKIHKRFVSNLGGVAIYAAFLIGFSVSGYAQSFEGYPYLVVALTLLFFTGLKDDLSVLSPYTKLMVQILASCVVIVGVGLQIDHFHGFLGLSEIPFLLSFPLTVFTLILIVNINRKLIKICAILLNA